MRRSPSAIQTDAQDALLAALTRLGVDASPGPSGPTTGGDRADFTFKVGSQTIVAVVKTVVTRAEAEHIRLDVKRRGAVVVVVADRIAEDAKATLRQAGVNYFDRRGELRIVVPPLIIDARVPGSASGAPRGADPLSSQVAKEVAIACLLTPTQAHGVREIATYVDRAPSAVSRAMAELRNAGLLTSKGEPAIPDLFHELSIRWRRQPVALRKLARPLEQGVDALGLGLSEPETTIGWALTDTRAAVAWDMPVIANGTYPPDFYVPTATVLRRAVGLLGESDDGQRRACTVAVAPVRLVCIRRHDRSQVSGETWPLANYIVVALDLAADKARGLEVLEQWEPKGITRAW